MKKIILLLGILFVTSTVAQAACDYNCVEPYDLNNKFRTFWGAVSGVNSVVENNVEAAITKEVLKIASADELKVDLNSRSARDLKNGIFKSFELNAKNALINDIHLKSLDLKTLCGFNYIKAVNKDVYEDISSSSPSKKSVLKDDYAEKAIKKIDKILTISSYCYIIDVVK